MSSLFRRRAIDRLVHEGRDAADEKTRRRAIGRERKLWLSLELIKAGMDRAQVWGWPNTYTYTKALGEQVIAGTDDLQYAIARPSVVESALRYPFPGWNEGFTTSAPLAFAGIKGQRMVPAGSKTILDIVPVDLVAASLIAMTAKTLVTPERRVYQLTSGDMNPFFASRSVELVGLYRRRHYRGRKIGNDFYNEMLARIEPVPVSEKAFKAFSAPFFARGAQVLRNVIEERKPSWGAPRISAFLERATEKLEAFENQANSLSNLVDLFLPFMWQNRYVFRSDNTRALYASIAPADREKIPWDPESIDWRDYFLSVHLPGLEKWVFPGLEEETERKTAIAAHRDLLELLEASVHTYRQRVAFRMVEGEREDRFTYGQVDRYAARVGSFLLRSGIQHGDRVLLISENRPEWGMTYFGILRAGGTVVPVDTQFSEAEVVNIARRSEATACLISERSARQLTGLFRAFSEANLGTQIHSLAQAMEGDTAFPDRTAHLDLGNDGTAQRRDVDPSKFCRAGREAGRCIQHRRRRWSGFGASTAPYV
jgi:long-chain acyl-CoA synthetase